jgi:hypothetical protein
MKIPFLSILLCFCSAIFAQNSMSPQQMKTKTDSILAEANVLYQYEKAAWITTDSAVSKKQLKNILGPYLVYQLKDSMITIFMNRTMDACIYEAIYTPYFDVPTKQIVATRPLNATEKRLHEISGKIVQQIEEKKYPITCPKEYNLNLELIPYEKGYKLYILTGTSQSKVIPFGNDYIFFADQQGNITSWKPFHTRLIDQPTVIDGNQVRSLSHSHRQEPFITATDICTFRLYAPMYDQEDFSVYSPVLSTYFKYILKDNTIEITENP